MTTITSNQDGTLMTWDTSNWHPIRTWAAHEGEAYCEAYRPDGGRIVSGGHDGLVKLWDPETGRLVRTFASHSGDVLSTAYSPDGTRLVSCSLWDRDGVTPGEIILWDPETGQRLLTLAGSRYGPRPEAYFSPDGQRLISGGYDATLEVWDARTGAEVLVLRPTGRGTEMYSTAISPDGRHIAAGDRQGRIHLWSAEPRR